MRHFFPQGIDSDFTYVNRRLIDATITTMHTFPPDRGMPIEETGPINRTLEGGHTRLNTCSTCLLGYSSMGNVTTTCNLLGVLIPHIFLKQGKICSCKIT